jgi:hypothetical protein
MAGQAPALSPSSAVAEAVADKEGERENRRQIVEHAAVHGFKERKILSRKFSPSFAWPTEGRPTLSSRRLRDVSARQEGGEGEE